jgi:hypothetical protein
MFSVGGHETARLIGMSVEEALLHKFDYHIDESDPDVVVLRCQDGAYVAAFSAKGAAGQGILEAAREDYRGLIEANAGFFLEPSRRGRESKEECLEPHEAKLSAIRSGHPPSVPTGSSSIGAGPSSRLEAGRGDLVPELEGGKERCMTWR